MSAFSEIEHIVIGGGPDLVCHWPRQGGLWCWGDEILAAYIEAPCKYTDPEQVGHGQGGIWQRGYVRLRRSTDAGATWTDSGVVFDNAQPVEAQRRALRLDDYEGHRGPDRESIDLSSPDTVLLMGRAWCGDEHDLPDGSTAHGNVTYGFRSPDRGRRWESVPSILWPHHTSTVVELANNVMPLGGARAVCWLVGSGGIEGVSEARLYAPSSTRRRTTAQPGTSTARSRATPRAGSLAPTLRFSRFPRGDGCARWDAGT